MEESSQLGVWDWKHPRKYITAEVYKELKFRGTRSMDTMCVGLMFVGVPDVRSELDMTGLAPVAISSSRAVPRRGAIARVQSRSLHCAFFALTSPSP